MKPLLDWLLLCRVFVMVIAAFVALCTLSGCAIVRAPNQCGNSIVGCF